MEFHIFWSMHETDSDEGFGRYHPEGARFRIGCRDGRWDKGYYRCQLMRCLTVAETNSLNSTTPNTEIRMTVTSCHKNWLMEE